MVHLEEKLFTKISQYKKKKSSITGIRKILPFYKKKKNINRTKRHEDYNEELQLFVVQNSEQ